MGLFQYLPGELRNKIYLYIAFPYSSITHICCNWKTPESFSADLLRTCRKINLEATPILYSSMCFQLPISLDIKTGPQQHTPELLCRRMLNLSRWPSPLMQFVRYLDIKLCFGRYWHHKKSTYVIEVPQTTFCDVASNFPALECLVLFHCNRSEQNRPWVLMSGVDGNSRVFFEDCLKPFMKLPKLKKILLGVYCDKNDRDFGPELADAVVQMDWFWSRERQHCADDLSSYANWQTGSNWGSYIYTLTSKSLNGHDDKVMDDMIQNSFFLRIIEGDIERI